MDLSKGFTVVVFDVSMNGAIGTSPSMVSLEESRRITSELKAKGELAMSVHESTLSCIDIFEKSSLRRLNE
jgi:hypothetical protein